MTDYTHRFRLIVGKENQAPDVTFVQTENTEAEAVYFELVGAVAALADDEEVDLDDERFAEILEAAGGKTPDQFVRDCVSWRDTNDLA